MSKHHKKQSNHIIFMMSMHCRNTCDHVENVDLCTFVVKMSRVEFTRFLSMSIAIHKALRHYGTMALRHQRTIKEKSKNNQRINPSKMEVAPQGCLHVINQKTNNQIN